jgi:signal transduction histidine kinase/CheY-like chemotaxis protein
VGLALVDAELRYVRVNGAFAELDGVAAAGHAGRRVDEMDGAAPLASDALRDVLATGRPAERQATVAGSGGDRHFRVSYFPVLREGAPSAAGVAVVDVTDATRAEATCRESEQRKDEFLSVLSHELRNPLAPIRNAVHVLSHGDPAGPAARRAREIVERQVGHLTRMVDDLLDVTRISKGKVTLRRARLDLGELVHRAAEDHRGLLEGRGLVLEVHVPGAPVWVEGDRTRLAQIVSNLLQNAARFTPDGGRVAVEVIRQGDLAELSVRDTGVGLAPGLQAHLFEPFVQGSRTLPRSEGGLGLGLALVKALAELHGGAVRAESAGEGRGATFAVTLPTEGARAREAPARDVAPAAPRGRRVLVVDDNVDAAATLADLVALYGHEALVAHDGPEAVAMAEAERPDLVLCDIGLPGMDGYEVARRLRRDAALAGTRLVAVSGNAQPSDVERAAAAGFDLHIAKPPDPHAIEQLLT